MYKKEEFVLPLRKPFSVALLLLAHVKFSRAKSLLSPCLNRKKTFTFVMLSCLISIKHMQKLPTYLIMFSVLSCAIFLTTFLETAV